MLWRGLPWRSQLLLGRWDVLPYQFFLPGFDTSLRSRSFWITLKVSTKMSLHGWLMSKNALLTPFPFSKLPWHGNMPWQPTIIGLPDYA
jgi:hypothetical protein